ncbi:MAG: MFS transporter, partial [Brevundimonas sp.]
VDATLVYVLLTIAMLAASPFFIFWGWLSDKVGRKPIILAGCLIAALTYFPLFNALTQAANPRLAAAAASAPVVVYADPADCNVQFDPIGKTVFNQSCDVAKSHLAKAGVTYTNIEAPAGTVAEVRIGDQSVIPSFRGDAMSTADFAAQKKTWDADLSAALTAAGYPAKADSALVNKPMVVLILFILGFYVTMVYGPIAAALVEMFPTNIRYTSMSLPYHIGNGWFGGFLPTTAFAIVAATGNIYSGLWYPIIVALATVVLGFLLVKEGKDVDIHA